MSGHKIVNETPTHSQAGVIEHRRKTGRGEAGAGSKTPGTREQRALGWEGRAARSGKGGVGMGGFPPAFSGTFKSFPLGSSRAQIQARCFPLGFSTFLS